MPKALSVSCALSHYMTVLTMAMTRVLMKTLLGDMTLELDGEKAPATVANFVAYAEAGHYDGTIFHRVINNFMVQGGGFDSDMRQKATNDPITNEANNGLKNDRGTIAMARTMDPHLRQHNSLSTFRTTIFSTSLVKTCRAGVMPCLAESWKARMFSTRCALYPLAARQVIRTFRTILLSSSQSP